MSKGPGKWQRAILAELEKREAFYLSELLPGQHTRANYVALLRAADRLPQAQAQVIRFTYSTRQDGHIVIVRPGLAFDRSQYDQARWKRGHEAWKAEQERLKRLAFTNGISVDVSPSSASVNTYDDGAIEAEYKIS